MRGETTITSVLEREGKVSFHKRRNNDTEKFVIYPLSCEGFMCKRLGEIPRISPLFPYYSLSLSLVTSLFSSLLPFIIAVTAFKQSKASPSCLLNLPSHFPLTSASLDILIFNCLTKIKHFVDTTLIN